MTTNMLRKAERDYRKTYNNDHLDKFRIFQREHNHLLYEKRYKHNKTLIQEADRDIKKLYNLSNNLLGRKSKPKIDISSVTTFDNFFYSKISNIIKSLPNCNLLPQSLYDCTSTLNNFNLTSINEITKLIKSTRSISSLDPLPLKLLQELTPIISPYVTAFFLTS